MTGQLSAAFCWKSCLWPTRKIPAPIPPKSKKSPRIVAIIFPPPNFFLALGMTEEISGGVLEPASSATGWIGD
jgi:hypothetical protein